MNVENILSFFTPQRLYRFILRRLVGSYLNSTGGNSLRLDQLDVQLLAGEIKLFDLDLNPGAINSHLAGSNLTVSSARVSRIRIVIPWRNIFSQRSKVCIEGLRIKLSPSLQGNHTSQTAGQPVITEAERTKPEGILLLSTMVRQVLGNVELLVKDAAVDVCVPLNTSLHILRCEISQILAVSPSSLQKSLSLKGLILRSVDFGEECILNLSDCVSVNVDLSNLSISGGLNSLRLHLSRPEQVAAISQAFRFFKGVDGAESEMMFHSVISDIVEPISPESRRKPFWYEESDLFNFMTDELKDQTLTDLSEPVVNTEPGLESAGDIPDTHFGDLDVNFNVKRTEIIFSADGMKITKLDSLLKF